MNKAPTNRRSSLAASMRAIQEDLAGAMEKFSSSYPQTDTGRDRWSRSYSQGSADLHLIESDLLSLREQCRHLDRTNVIYEGLVNRAVDNVVGTGFTFQMRTDDEVLNADVEAAFEEWSTTGADFYGEMSLAELERLAFRSLLVDGDMGFVRVNDGTLQPIEGDLLATPRGKWGDANYEQGVEKDRFGRPVRYHVAPWTSYGMPDTSNTTPVLAADFAHLANRKRFSQTRGVPALAGALILFERLDDYVEATLAAAQVGACQSLMILTELGAALGEKLKDNSETSADNRTQQVQEMEAGTIWHLKPGEAVEQIKPEQPAPQFDAFVDKLLRLLGLGLGMPLELVSLDMSKANYSSARTGLLQAYLAFRGWQQLLVNRFFRKVSNWTLPRLLRQLGADDTKANRRHLWVPPGWRWIDPTAETNAAKTACASGLKTLQEAAADEGRYWRDLLGQRKTEIQAAIAAATDLGGDVSWRDLIPAEMRAAAPPPPEEKKKDAA